MTMESYCILYCFCRSISIIPRFSSNDMNFITIWESCQRDMLHLFLQSIVLCNKRVVNSSLWVWNGPREEKTFFFGYRLWIRIETTVFLFFYYPPSTGKIIWRCQSLWPIQGNHIGALSSSSYILIIIFSSSYERYEANYIT